MARGQKKSCLLLLQDWLRECGHEGGGEKRANGGGGHADGGCRHADGSCRHADGSRRRADGRGRGVAWQGPPCGWQGPPCGWRAGPRGWQAPPCSWQRRVGWQGGRRHGRGRRRLLRGGGCHPRGGRRGGTIRGPGTGGPGQAGKWSGRVVASVGGGRRRDAFPATSPEALPGVSRKRLIGCGGAGYRLLPMPSTGTTSKYKRPEMRAGLQQRDR
jgi:hypothetical protein